MVAWLDCGLIALAGVSFFASAITEEREEGTLPMLRIAGISDVGLLLGKSTSRLVSSALLLWVQFPFILAAITLGGITLWQVAAACLALFAWLLLLANAGLFCSVLCRRSGAASALMGIFVATQLGAGYLYRSMPAAWTAPRAFGWCGFFGRWAQFLNELSIGHRLRETMQTGFKGSIIGDQVVFSVTASAVLFLAAWGFFHWLADLSPEAPGINALTWRRGRRRRVWRDALAWKEFQCIAGGPLGCLARVGLLAASLVGLTWGLKQLATTGMTPRWGEWAVIVLVVCIAFDLCLWATRILSDDWRMAVLPVLLLTPHTPASICLGKVRGCLLSILPGLLLLLWVSWHYDDHQTLAAWLERPLAWSALGGFVLFLHVVAYLSLRFVWGALPLALGMLFIGNTCIVYPVLSLGVAITQVMWGFTDFQSAVMVLNIGLVCAAIGLQMGIVRQLERAASR
jgi:hypothetical protein